MRVFGLWRHDGWDAEWAGIPITSPYFWQDEDICTEKLLRHVFRSDTEEEMPLLKARITCLREAGQVLCDVRVELLYVFWELTGAAI